MKKIIFGLIVIMMMILASFSAFAVGLYSESEFVQITMVNQEPDPVEPGSVVELRFKTENYGQENAEDVTIELLPEYPFSMYAGTAIRMIGSVHGRQIGDIGVISKFKVRVDPDAAEGDTQIKLRYRLGDGAWTTIDTFTVDVQSPSSIVKIDSVESLQIKPGGQQTVKITLTNIADSLVKDVKVKLDLAGIPLAPIGSSNEQVIESIGPKESVTLEFKLIAEPGADAGVYKIPLTLAYLDEVSASYSVNNTIGLIIGEEPDMTVVLDDSTIKMVGEKGTISIRFVNKGATNVKFLNVKLGNSDSYDILSTPQSYIGNIDSDDYEDTDFDIFVRENAGKEVKLPLSIEYSDANNKKFTRNKELSLRLFSTEEAKKIGLIKASSGVGIIIIVVIVVGGFLIYRRFKKRKNRSK